MEIAKHSNGNVRIRLDEKDFDKLTSGEIIKEMFPNGNTVEVMLSDIGYAHMISILEKKESNL